MVTATVTMRVGKPLVSGYLAAPRDTIMSFPRVQTTVLCHAGGKTLGLEQDLHHKKQQENKFFDQQQERPSFYQTRTLSR